MENWLQKPRKNSQMVRLKLREGLWNGMKISMLKSGLSRLNEELKGGQGNFKNDLTERVRNYHLRNDQLSVEGGIGELAQKYGLGKKLDEYINNNVIGGLRGRLAYTLDVLTSMKDAAEDAAELTDVITFIPTGGTSAAVQVPIYVATQTVYSLLAGILGYSSGIYTFDKKGTKSYFSDTAKGYIGALGNVVPVLGSVFELGTNIDDKRPRIAEAASRKTAQWLVGEIAKEKRINLEETPELEKIVGSYVPKGSTWRQKLMDYAGRFRFKNPIYRSDISNAQYQTN